MLFARNAVHPQRAYGEHVGEEVELCCDQLEGEILYEIAEEDVTALITLMAALMTGVGIVRARR